MLSFNCFPQGLLQRGQELYTVYTLPYLKVVGKSVQSPGMSALMSELKDCVTHCTPWNFRISKFTSSRCPEIQGHQEATTGKLPVCFARWSGEDFRTPVRYHEWLHKYE